MNKLSIALILLGLAGLVSAGSISGNSAENLLKSLEEYFLPKGDELSSTLLSQVQALLKRIHNLDNCDVGLAGGIFGLVDNERARTVPKEIIEKVRQFRMDQLSLCKDQYAKNVIEEVSRLTPEETDLINDLRSTVVSENNGQSLLPVIPSHPLEEGIVKFVLQRGGLQELNSKKAYKQGFKEKFNSLVAEVCNSVNDKLGSIRVFDHFIYSRFIFDPDSSLLSQVDKSTRDWITNYKICSRILNDPLMRPRDLEELAKTKFTGRKWF